MKLFNILNEIEFKGDRSNILLKWVLALAGSAIVGAFIIGQIRMTRLNRLDDIEALAKQGIEATTKLEERVESGFQETDAKIDKIYDDGMESFEKYYKLNDEQFNLIIDYRNSDSELLKKMIEMSSKENAIEIENDLEKSQREEIKISEPSVIIFQEMATGISRYIVSGASADYLDTLNMEKYEILSRSNSVDHPGLYDFEYIDKK
jgi:hypothetical protein